MAEGGSKLSEERIFECLKSLHVPVRMNDLKVPSKDFIVLVFECFLRDLQVDISSPKLRNWDAVKHFEEADIYEEAQLLALLAMSVNYITNSCGLNITIKDIVEPKPKRTKKILNYIIIFWNYYLQKYARFHSIVEEYESEKIRVQEVMNEIQLMDEKRNDLLVVLKNMDPSKEELFNIVKVKQEKAEKLKAESERLEIEYRALKAKEVDVRNQIGSIDVSIITAKERIQELSQKILSSPERIRTEMQRLTDKIKNEDVKIKECESREKEAVKKLQLLEEKEKEGDEIMTILNETKDIYHNLRDLVKSTMDVNQKITNEEAELKRLETDLEQKEDWKQQQMQKSVKVALHNKKQIETLEEVLKQNHGEEAKLQKKAEFLKTSINKLQEDINSKSDNILEVIKKSKEAEAKSIEREAQFRERMKSISNTFKTDCEEVTEMIKKTFNEK